MLAPITRHFVTVGRRQVHYRRAGSGAPIILLHASPSSSWALDTFTQVFGTRFAALALDTPGFGLSDSLSISVPEATDYADAMAETMDALGIEKAGIFGSHTGATIACEFARRHPHRVTLAVFDGYPAYPKAEQDANLAHYLPKFEPVWHGLHLVDFWLRYREMSNFWPWYAPSRSTRAEASGRELEGMHRMVLAGFLSGRGYDKGYAAVFRHDAMGAAAALKVPTCFAGREGDSLIRALKVLGELPAGCWRATMPNDDLGAAEKYLQMYLDRPLWDPAPPPPATTHRLGAVSKRFVETRFGPVLVRMTGTGDGTPLVMLPALPETSETLEPEMMALESKRPVISLDLPGSGDSDSTPLVSVAAYADALGEILDALNLAKFDLAGRNLGASIAAAFAQGKPHRVNRLILEGPMALPAPLRQAMGPNYAPPIELERFGGHILKLWNRLRNEQLYFPWYSETVDAIRRIEPELDPDPLTLRITGLLKQYRNVAPIWRAAFADALVDRLPQLKVPTLVCARESDVFADFVEEATRAVPSAGHARLPRDAAGIAAVFNGFL